MDNLTQPTNPAWRRGFAFRTALLLALACVALAAGANSSPAETAVQNQRKALVFGRGLPFTDHGGPTHPQAAKNNFLNSVGNPGNDPAKGWTCDLSYDLLLRLGMDPD